MDNFSPEVHISNNKLINSGLLSNKLNNWTPEGNPSKNLENLVNVISGLPALTAFSIITGLIFLKISE